MISEKIKRSFNFFAESLALCREMIYNISCIKIIFYEVENGS